MTVSLQGIYKFRRFGEQLNLHQQGEESYLVALFMEMKSVSETSYFINLLTQLSTRESFIEFCRRENFKTYKGQNCV
jgi:hypothetical protein